MSHCQRDLAERYLRDATMSGVAAAGEEFAIEWCAAHRCTIVELQDALGSEDAATEAQIERFESEEYGRTVMREAALERGQRWTL